MHTFLCTSEVLVEVSKPVDRGLYNPFSFQTSWFGMAVSDLGMPSFNIQHPTCSLSVIFYSNRALFLTYKLPWYYRCYLKQNWKKSHMLSSHHACTTVIPSTWATAKKSISHFQLIQNSAATLLTISERHNHATLNLATLQWLPVSYRGYFNFYLFLQVLDYIYIMDLFRPY